MKQASFIAAGAALVTLAAATSGQAAIRITEWLYSGESGEFVEFTNTGNAAIDMTGWGYDDSDSAQGLVSLSAFGTVQPGESVILTEAEASGFRLAWSLSASVDVIGDNVQNLGRADSIKLFDGSSNLIDQLDYGDNTIGGPRTQVVSGTTLPEYLGTNDVTRWFASTIGDVHNASSSSDGDIASPGTYAVPEPGAMAGLALMGLALAHRRRR